ncbi:MAG: hypothetical protein G3M78_08425 [Candidatus Nitrohelix vancouverensis]|uniref:AAA+ ATPase domain-containing protein n=1 Tax=Candidatus Nitrohelix vancouverensis TaxID=2705534 RepID=A0A7T0C2Q9_9BACT|nr:MAG: hypothetical protein G3M78_08425 [Candidatus Nitrohelix vancouverensis]
MPSSDANPRQLIFDFPGHAEFSFENFVVAPDSSQAFQAARDISSASSPLEFSSLFLHGGPNLGKTHLLIALGNALSKNFPNKKTCYVDCRELLRTGASPALSAEKTQQLADGDFILLDDVDCGLDQLAFQESLYHIYNSISDRQGKIIFASRNAPQSIQASDFLTSRFLWGLTAEIGPLDFDSMGRLIIKLGKDCGVAMPENAAQFLMNRIARDFVSVRNAVDAINRFSLTHKRKVTIPLIREALELD